eukprot:Clim_evm1s44 gene=Clim_evmTU1s44
MAQLYIRDGTQLFTKSDYSVRPKVLDDPQYGEHGFVKANGIRFHFVSKGSGPLLLLLHGFPECWFSWRHQLVALSRHFQVVAVDLRGYGETQKPGSVSDYAWDVIAEDVKQIIKGLGHESASLMGHDWGALICWKFAIEYPHLVDKMIISDVPHPKAVQMLSNFQQLRKSWYVFLFQLPWLPEFYMSAYDYKASDTMFHGKHVGIVREESRMNPEELYVYRYYLAQPFAVFGALGYYRNVFTIEGNPAFMPDETVIIKVPTLVLWGEKDGAFEISAAKDSLQYVKPGFGQLKIIPNASHWLQQDAPREFNDASLDFLLSDGAIGN